MLVSELGEFGLIDRIARLIGPASPGVIVGIGDDVAVLQSSGPEYLLATCDVQIENVHFLRSSITPYQLGKKVVAINVSDIAAVGGIPTWALVSLALPLDTETDFVDELYRGMQEQLQSAGSCVVGGNLSQISAEVIIDLFLLGKVPAENLVLRKGAMEGNSILVTGTLGDSRAGLELIRDTNLRVSEKIRLSLVDRHLTPCPRLKEGQALARTGKVTAMVDVSDGLLSDIRHICRESRVGAEIWVADLPVSQKCIEAALVAGQEPSDWALTGGEDYELLFTSSPRHVQEIQTILLNETGTPSHIIGRICAESSGITGRTTDGGQVLYSKETMGWDHFGREGPKGQRLKD